MPWAEMSVYAVAKMLGGSKVLRHNIQTQLDVHQMLIVGVPCTAINHLARNVGFSSAAEKQLLIESILGMSMRTFTRYKEEPGYCLRRVNGEKVWKMAHIAARAFSVLGDQREVLVWLNRPATGLGGEKPIDLLSTVVGTEMVEEFLTQLEYGVYV